MVNPAWLQALTIGLLLSMALLCVVYGLQLRRRAPAQRWPLQLFYYSQALLLLGLGIDRHFGLLAWLTGRSRFWAMRDGWYYTRRTFQFNLVVGLMIGGLLLFGAACWYFRPILRQHWLPLLGAIGLLTYVVVRAVSLHAVDDILAERLWGLRLDRLLEIGGAVFLLCTLNLAFYWQRQRHL